MKHEGREPDRPHARVLTSASRSRMNSSEGNTKRISLEENHGSLIHQSIQDDENTITRRR